MSDRPDPEKASAFLEAVFQWLCEDWEKRTGLTDPAVSKATTNGQSAAVLEQHSPTVPTLAD